LLILASRNTNEITKLGSGNIFKEKYVFKIKTDVNDENILWLSGSGGFCKNGQKNFRHHLVSSKGHQQGIKIK